MPKLSKSMRKGSDFAVLQGGQLPKGILRSRIVKFKQKLASEINEKSAIQQKAAKHFRRIQTLADTESAGMARAANGLREITDRLAKQKLAAPRKMIVQPPWTWGTYTLKFTPPYAGLGTYSVGQISSVTGNPTISATGIDNIGQMSCSVTTDFKDPSSGTASNLLGIYFKPLFADATVRISFDSEIAFSWFVNSIQNKEAISEAQGLIELYQYDGYFVQPPLRRAAYLGWNEVGFNNLDFDFISQSGPTWSLEAQVSSAHFYFLVLRLSCTATGSGWPGSLAGANATVTIPSITVTVTANPIVLAK